MFISLWVLQISCAASNILLKFIIYSVQANIILLLKSFITDILHK